MASDFFRAISSPLSWFSSSESKEIIERRKREDQMRNLETCLQRLRLGVRHFKNKSDILMTQMEKARKHGQKQELLTHYSNYNLCIMKKTELEKLIRNLSGLEYSMQSAEFSVGAMDVMKQSSEFFLSIGQTIDMPMIDQNISVIQDQEMMVGEMSDALIHPFSKHALENHEPDEVMLQAVESLLQSGEGPSRPREGAEDLAIIDLPRIPDDVRQISKPTAKKRKKPKKMTAKPIF